MPGQETKVAHFRAALLARDDRGWLVAMHRGLDERPCGTVTAMLPGRSRYLFRAQTPDGRVMAEGSVGDHDSRAPEDIALAIWTALVDLAPTQGALDRRP